MVWHVSTGPVCDISYGTSLDSTPKLLKAMCERMTACGPAGEHGKLLSIIIIFLESNFAFLVK